MVARFPAEPSHDNGCNGNDPVAVLGTMRRNSTGTSLKPVISCRPYFTIPKFMCPPHTTNVTRDDHVGLS